ncbi:transmembrane amino acid transporter protein-domain-containing protein [Dissophora ornata]|nr:transmembrane amino acid transporter protein-domain-containing protein [Dissophora ornata]
MSKEFPGKIELHGESTKEELQAESLAAYDHHSSYTNIKDVPFEEFLHYSLIQRTKEEHEARQKSGEDDMRNPFGNLETQAVNMTPDELERSNARRALRQAGWAAVFFLITTDILGPFNAPIAIADLGYVPGVLLYIFMGIFAFYCGILLWRLFIHLDSDRYPVKTYADIAERIFGRSARHICTVLQSLQLIVNVGVICLSNGQSLAQIVAGENGTGYICFSLAIIIWALFGMVIGQIRTLKNFSFLANFAVWINLLIIFTSMGFIAHSPPNYAAAYLNGAVPGPITTTAFVSLPTTTKINGIMQMVFAYGGAMIFPEIMAEMRRPMDFWKGMACAQTLIFAAYLMYGIFVYAYQGQFTLPLAYQGVSKYSWQTVGNILALVTGIIAAGLYGNIGIKVAYINIVEDWFKGPSLLSRKGHAIWAVMVIVYWALAYIVGSAVPQVENISSLIAAICIMQFSYTFPPILRFGYDVLTDAMSEDSLYVPGNGTAGRVDTWKDASRWRRGLLTGRVWFKTLNFVLFIGFSVMAILGMWGSGVSIQSAFQVQGAATSFGCSAPV